MVYLIILWLLELQVTKPRWFIQSIQSRIAKFKLELKVWYNKFIIHTFHSNVRLWLHSWTICKKKKVYNAKYKLQFVCLVYKESQVFCLQREVLLLLQVFLASSSSNQSNLCLHPSLACHSWNKKRKS